MTDAVKKLYEAARGLSVDEQLQLGEMLVAANDDDFDAQEREALHAAMDEAEQQLDAGQSVSEDELWNRLKAIRETQDSAASGAC